MLYPLIFNYLFATSIFWDEQFLNGALLLFFLPCSTYFILLLRLLGYTFASEWALLLDWTGIRTEKNT